MHGSRVKLSAMMASLLFVVSCSFGNTATQSQNKTLVVETAFQTVNGLDPARTVGITTGEVLDQMYQTLLGFDANDPTKVDPVLAQSYVASPDGKSVTLKLRQDIRFSDGTQMTSADVVYSIMRQQNIKAENAVHVAGLTVTAIDKYTVLVTSAQANPALRYTLAYQYNLILNSKVVQANGGSDAPDANKTDTAEAFLSQQSAGSGPYELVSMDPASQIILKSNPNYSGPKPAYSKVVFQNETADVQMLDVQKGANTIALDISASQAATLDKTKVDIKSVPALNTFQISFNLNPAISPASANANFRQAVRYGIDYKELLTIAGVGAVQASSLLAQGIPGAIPPNQLVTRDVTKAKSFLAQSGLTNPTITMEYESDSTPEGQSYATLAQAIQSNLQEVGITVNLQPSVSTAFSTRWRGGKTQMILRELGGGTYDPSTALLWVTLLGEQWMGWPKDVSAPFDALVTQIKAATTNEQRVPLYMQLVTSLNDAAVDIPLFNAGLVLVASKSVGGLNLNGILLIYLSQLT